MNLEQTDRNVCLADFANVNCLLGPLDNIISRNMLPILRMIFAPTKTNTGTGTTSAAHTIGVTTVVALHTASYS